MNALVQPQVVGTDRTHQSQLPLLEVDNVSFGFGARTVVDQVSLSVRRHDYLAILGPNGGGKTTLLKLLLGLYRPWSGEIRWHLDENGESVRARFGWVPQFANFDRSFPLDVFDAVRLGRAAQRGLLRRWNSADQSATERALERLGLSGLRRRSLRDLSGGELQRTLIARAIVCDPVILLLDEPAASIDALSRDILLRTLRELNHDIPIVVVTHDLTLFARDIKQVACMNRQLHYHDGPQLPQAALEHLFGCPVEMLGHLHDPETCPAHSHDHSQAHPQTGRTPAP